jgi:hypothetical protein
MAIPLLTTLPTPPLPTDPEEIFDSRAGATLLAQKILVDEMNTSTIPGINLARTVAEASAESAEESATSALASKDTAVANALATASDRVVVVASALQVATDAAQVALDAEAVAQALEDIEGGPVASIGGFTGVVTAEDVNSIVRARTFARITAFL